MLRGDQGGSGYAEDSRLGNQEESGGVGQALIEIAVGSKGWIRSDQRGGCDEIQSENRQRAGPSKPSCIDRKT